MARHRYRLWMDVCEADDGNLTMPVLKEMLDAMQSAVKLEIPPDKARVIKIDPSARGWHAHYGSVGCVGCTGNSTDGRCQETSDTLNLFPARTTE